MIDEDGKLVKSVFESMRLDEISAVDRPAQGEGARVAIMKRADVEKRSLLLTPTDGHTHTLVDEVAPSARAQAGETSFNEGHSHPWVRDPDTGTFTVGMAAGHTHNVQLDYRTLDVAVSLEKAEDGSPDPSDASKQASGDSPADAVGNVPNEVAMTEKNDQTVERDEAVAKQLEELTKRAERAEKVSELSDAQRGIFKGLDEAGQDAFLALTPEQRDAQVAKAAEANAVVYTDSEGVEYRKNDDPRLVALAKRADKEKEMREEEEEQRKSADLRRRAEELAHLPGDIDARVALLKGIDALPEAERAPALEALKASDAAVSKAFERAGTSATPSTDDNPLEGIAKRLHEADPNLTPEQAMAKALRTTEGEQAYAKQLGLIS